jgi:hypothetical protein
MLPFPWATSSSLNDLNKFPKSSPMAKEVVQSGHTEVRFLMGVERKRYLTGPGSIESYERGLTSNLLWSSG